MYLHLFLIQGKEGLGLFPKAYMSMRPGSEKKKKNKTGKDFQELEESRQTHPLHIPPFPSTPPKKEPKSFQQGGNWKSQEERLLPYILTEILD